MKRIPVPYSTKDVAEMLGVTPKTIQNYLNKGKIPYSVKLPGGAHRFSEQDIQTIKEQFYAEDRTEDLQ